MAEFNEINFINATPKLFDRDMSVENEVRSDRRSGVMFAEQPDRKRSPFNILARSDDIVRLLLQKGPTMSLLQAPGERPFSKTQINRPDSMTRVLVVEDQRSLLRNLVRGLAEEGYDVLGTASISEAQEGLARQPDIVVLDLMLPDGSGVELVARLRREGFRRPILILTARDSVDDRVEGLDAGADDYLVKPFSFTELLARLRALLRRGSLEHHAIIRVDDLEIDLLKRAAIRGGHQLDLSNRQFELLSYLMQHAHSVVSRDMIARDVWKEATATWTNVIEVHIAQLRRKIERADWPPILHTVRGQGYLLGKIP